MDIMPAIRVCNLPEETHRALKLRATENGRSIDAEILEIIENALLPPNRVKLGSELAAIGREFGGIDLDIERD